MQLYIGKQHGEIGLEDAWDLMEQYPKYAKRALSSAIKSEGWRLRGIIKDTIRQGGPNGSWPKLNPHTGVLNRAKKGWVKNYRLSRKGVKKGEAAKRIYKQVMLSTKTAPLLRLAGATRYYYDKDLMVARIGFLTGAGKSPGATAVLAKKHAMGYRVPVTPRSRRRAFGLGFPLKKSTTELVTPPRPVVGPVFDAEEKAIVRNINQNTMNNIQRYITGSPKKS